MKVGNHILAINGESLSGRTLPEIEDMLNNCGNSVTLKIKKNIKSSKEFLTIIISLIFWYCRGTVKATKPSRKGEPSLIL